jgi:lysophospholipase L1-like esterase
MKKILLAAFGLAGAATALAQDMFLFDFSADAKPGCTHVSRTNLYSAETGFGFEPNTNTAAGAPFLFSVKLPEGNYAVTITFGGDAKTSLNTVKAEQRRLMLEKIPGGETRTFIAHLHTPKISETEHVKLKQREKDTETVNWDDKLTLEFNGKNPSPATVKILGVNLPTVFLAGDSTVCDQPAEPWNSWGQMLPRFFKPEIAVANYAESGESIKSSIGAKRFDKIFSTMKKGDYLFVQFGHNDMKDKATNALEVYKSNLKKIVARTRELGGTPVLVTSMERKNGVEQDTLAGYPDAAREVAKAENVALIDLNAMSRVFYKALGADLDKAFQDGTHHNNYGSYELAKCIALGIQQDKLPLAKSLVDDFSFDPAKPDAVATFEMAVSPNASALKPLGN